MPTERDDTAHRGRLIGRLVDRALAELPDQRRPGADEALDHRSLGVGLRLGLERPEQARRLLALLEGEAAGRAEVPADETGETPVVRGSTDDGPGDGAPVPTGSLLLERSAALAPSELAGLGPDVVFGWAGGLRQEEILAIGGVVRDMLDAGSPRDTGRGFGLAWDAGVRLPRRDLQALFQAFSALEVVVGGVLAARDLRHGGAPAARSSGLGAMFSSWLPRRDPGQEQAAAVLDRSGPDARRGLVALWNAWMAMRYRALIPQATFDLLVRPWVTVVGPVPDP